MPKILNDPKERMLQEVHRLLTREGYNAVTVRAVAQGCGVGVGTVYNYFPSKEAMLAEHLLSHWQECVAAIEQVSRESTQPEPVARCIYQQLVGFAQSHMEVFGAEAARQSFAGSFSPYHSVLRSQLAAPLRKFCDSDFAAEFLAEAILTWSMAGKRFCELWGLLRPLLKDKENENDVQL